MDEGCVLREAPPAPAGAPPSKEGGFGGRDEGYVRTLRGVPTSYPRPGAVRRLCERRRTCDT
ncbi:MAG: hypothetical protein LBM98_03565 [Oscillospiraceae bacterium]|nr:hypothetical protein [Oscillospiraceae bacterium]